VHGGVISTLLDTALGCAVHTKLEPGEGYATGEVIHVGRSVGTCWRTPKATLHIVRRG
jgi:acyl-coenzyme A thioesterase PaaI-like protein